MRFQDCLNRVSSSVGKFRDSLGFQKDDIQVHNVSYWRTLVVSTRRNVNLILALTLPDKV